MAAPLSPTKLLICPSCKARLPQGDLQAGQKCRCGRCGKILVVPGKQSPPKPPTQPKLFGFACRVCETRLTARTTDVGKKLRCPDCHAKNEIPKPPKPPRPKQTPEAMHGQQYGLWGVDEAPSNEELLARQPKFYPVYCRACNTLMHAQQKQVGQLLSCPDCGVQTEVPPPPAEETRPSNIVPDGEEYQLEEPEIDLEVFEQPAEPPRPTEKPKKTLRDELQEEYGKRPELPRVPLLQGVLKMFLRNPIPIWWLGLCFAAELMTVLFLLGAAMIGVPYGPLFSLWCFVGAAGCGFLFFTGLAAMLMAILVDSSEGNDKLYHPPDVNLIEWFGPAIYLVIALAVTAAPGILIGGAIGFATIGSSVGMFVLLPIVVLSMLEIGSPIGVLSPRVLASLVRRPLHWIAFYIVAGVLEVGFFFAALFMVVMPILLLAFFPVWITGNMLYFRLLGRLGWWLGESLAIAEPKPSE